MSATSIITSSLYHTKIKGLISYALGLLQTILFGGLFLLFKDSVPVVRLYVILLTIYVFFSLVSLYVLDKFYHKDLVTEGIANLIVSFMMPNTVLFYVLPYMAILFKLGFG